jgi:transcriptional regulator with XRE-family HTH domain
LMDDRHYNCAELAVRAGIPLSTMSRVLSGEVEIPGFDVVVSISKALGVPIDEFTKGSDEDNLVTLTLQGIDQKGVLRDLAKVISDEDQNILRCFAISDSDQARVVLVFEMPTIEQMKRICTQLKKTQTITDMRIEFSAPAALTEYITHFLRGSQNSAGSHAI